MVIYPQGARSNCCEDACSVVTTKRACEAMRSDECELCLCAWNEAQRQHEPSRFLCEAVPPPPEKEPRKVEVFGEGHIIGGIVGVLFVGGACLGCCFFTQQPRRLQMRMSWKGLFREREKKQVQGEQSSEEASKEFCFESRENFESFQHPQASTLSAVSLSTDDDQRRSSCEPDLEAGQTEQKRTEPNIACFKLAPLHREERGQPGSLIAVSKRNIPPALRHVAQENLHGSSSSSVQSEELAGASEEEAELGEDEELPIASRTGSPIAQGRRSCSPLAAARAYSPMAAARDVRDLFARGTSKGGR
eukprot:CAMPEP_0181304582 /NCGR_PEP_ID=MMETSP1101-20121128/9234_1 /TAXON_ID=46948 /ORGANISM="Rhodomonas abbreviata, Strain Caron Lab Isolate" /LENGTH=304 /DNA_ID=CAMNT_0023410363 /DNA_START=239 /DNA_END=1153 /DNA_ORIENTATION=-